MNVDEMRKRLEDFCENNACGGCLFENFVICDFDGCSDDAVKEAYNIAFGKEEEINHPDRYAGGKFECIDVMVDVFGADAVKHFCILNAFKYLWRSEKKNGVEDIKKAVWYLNKYIELGGEE